jgi:hypothetical protein
MPVWTQFLVVLVILHTSIRNLNDAMCERAFKKENTWAEINVIASLFLSMKLDGTLPWYASINRWICIR